MCVCTCVLHNLLMNINRSDSMCYGMYCIHFVCIQSAELKVQSYMRTQDLENYAEHTNSSLLYLTLEALGRSTHVQCHPLTCIDLYVPASYICIHCTYVCAAVLCACQFIIEMLPSCCLTCVYIILCTLISFEFHIIFYFSALTFLLIPPSPRLSFQFFPLLWLL